MIYRERNLSIVFNYLLDILNIVNTKKLSWPNWSRMLSSNANGSYCVFISLELAAENKT